MRSVWTLLIGMALISSSFVASGCASSRRVVRRTRTTPSQARMAQRNLRSKAAVRSKAVARANTQSSRVQSPRFATFGQPSVSEPSPMYAEPSPMYAEPSPMYTQPALSTYAPSYEPAVAVYPATTYTDSYGEYVQATDYAQAASYSQQTYASPMSYDASYVEPSYATPYVDYTSASGFNNGTPGMSADGAPTALWIDPATNQSTEVLDPCGIASSDKQWVDVTSRGAPATPCTSCTTSTCASGTCALPSPFSGSCTDGSCDLVGGDCANGQCGLPPVK